MCVCEGAFTQQQGQNGDTTKTEAQVHVPRGFLPGEPSFNFMAAVNTSTGKRSSLPQTRQFLTLLSQLCRDPAVGVRNGEEA